VLKEDDFQTVTLEHIKAARQQMILARETHLDSLVYRLEDPRVRHVMEVLMTGDSDTEMVESDGFRICQDLGLVSIEHSTPVIANPIYREVLARQISYGTQMAIPAPEFRWKKDDGSLDMDALLKEFQKFWRENSAVWGEKSKYTEAFPHLLLQAFLQRLVNGGGRIEREYAAGRGRMDLYIEYNNAGTIIEIKLLRDKQTLTTVQAKGLEQIEKYRDTRAPDVPAYLVIFDRRSSAAKRSWKSRLYWKTQNGITIVGC
jgi:hypothetical protein